MIRRPPPGPRIVESPTGISARGAALYHRVSTRDQDPTLARAELLAAAAGRGLAVALDVEEHGSGARNDRPGLLRVLDAAHRGQVGAVVVWKLDRFGRSTVDLLHNIQAITRAGVRFVAVSQGIDLRGGAGDAMGNLMLTVLAGVAEFERELACERIHLGLARARREGKRFGRPRDAGAPPPGTVRHLRSLGLSWADVAGRLGCSAAMARRVLERDPGHKVAPPIPSEAETDGGAGGRKPQDGAN